MQRLGRGSNYPIENVSPEAGICLDLYLQGKTPESIAIALKWKLSKSIGSVKKSTITHSKSWQLKQSQN